MSLLLDQLAPPTPGEENVGGATARAGDEVRARVPSSSLSFERLHQVARTQINAATLCRRE